MNLADFRNALKALDRNPPAFRANPERSRAFLEIGRFFDECIGAGRACDLKKRPSEVWRLIEPRLRAAADDVPATVLPRRGVAAWQMYNDGVIVKTDEVVIGLDVIPMPRFFGWNEPEGLTARLAGLVDILLVTHDHEDHYDRPLVRACLNMGKPVLLPDALARDWERDANLHPVCDGWKLDLCDLRITARRGFHVWREKIDDVPLAYYEVTCQEGYTFLFGGDVDYTKAFEKTPGQAVDLLFLPWRNPNERFEDGRPEQTGTTLDAVRVALDRVSPAALLYEHVAELNHIYESWAPASCDMALALKDHVGIPSELLFWGEKILLH